MLLHGEAKRLKMLAYKMDEAQLRTKISTKRQLVSNSVPGAGL
jgi:hypothetical protein